MVSYEMTGINIVTGDEIRIALKAPSVAMAILEADEMGVKVEPANVRSVAHSPSATKRFSQENDNASPIATAIAAVIFYGGLAVGLSFLWRYTHPSPTVTPKNVPVAVMATPAPLPAAPRPSLSLSAAPTPVSVVITAPTFMPVAMNVEIPMMERRTAATILALDQADAQLFPLSRTDGATYWASRARHYESLDSRGADPDFVHLVSEYVPLFETLAVTVGERNAKRQPIADAIHDVTERPESFGLAAGQEMVVAAATHRLSAIDNEYQPRIDALQRQVDQLEDRKHALLAQLQQKYGTPMKEYPPADNNVRTTTQAPEVAFVP